MITAVSQQCCDDDIIYYRTDTVENDYMITNMLQ